MGGVGAVHFLQILFVHVKQMVGFLRPILYKDTVIKITNSYSAVQEFSIWTTRKGHA